MRKFVILTLIFSLCSCMFNSEVKASVQLSSDVDGFHSVKAILQAIEEIPEYIIDEGLVKTARWIEENSGLKTTIQGERLLFDLNEKKEISIKNINIPACVGAIGVAIISNGIPISKILKLKKAIGMFGGTIKLVESIKYFYDQYRKQGNSRKVALKKASQKVSNQVDKNLRPALLDFFNISAVIGACT
ncbi:hypothetical protein [Bacillus altitudinis]|jgi:hypothetical protein|uniref:hypothetical protein n=1 Tax=Bacillus altitudinis TaxID=293387 RepID=UPI001568DACD|nr:hypothetical protein [Bacillus altitudinis]MCY7450466.1 hypothetical protein [Bacillus altitudinis]MCY7453606.1 hypothetical protein [Bacillus altitudinis]NQD51360.1 hypothetical protein [Bacillus altitudinis]QKJ42155.1 hypothetical protein HRJ37_18880 [Bacillus altitudinis]UTX08704.1 hypothetical protein NMH04_18310 [Bacillus altitudinis]